MCRAMCGTGAPMCLCIVWFSFSFSSSFCRELCVCSGLLLSLTPAGDSCESYIILSLSLKGDSCEAWHVHATRVRVRVCSGLSFSFPSSLSSRPSLPDGCAVHDVPNGCVHLWSGREAFWGRVLLDPAARRGIHISSSALLPLTPEGDSCEACSLLSLTPKGDCCELYIISSLTLKGDSCETWHAHSTHCTHSPTHASF